MKTNMEQPSSCPVLQHGSEGAPPYVTYAHMDRLHELQQPRSDSPRELTFLLISHVKELLFRAVLVEVDQAREQLRESQVDQACESLSRAVRAQRLLVNVWDTMTALSPDEFLAFRDILGEASGTQSFMYRALEFTLGNKDPRTVAQCSGYMDLYPELTKAFRAPSLYDEALSLLVRRGATIPRDVYEREPGAPYTPSTDVEQAWLAVYKEPGRWRQAHRLAEMLTEVSYQFSHWRATHLLVVERMLGSKPGTGGTTGLDWLRSVNEHRFFPELWAVRTLL
ncbi:tryptophan 2,3-dioxygenase [Streptomyces sp. NPDC002187]|uniref:tryptophan 2,3-dioxygenase n=1 Tax=Streptomyces sp. NPDC002187 TaxID=3364637 RepID=UPI0036752487